MMDHVADLLASRGWTVRRQEVTPGRANVWATRGAGAVTLSTHLDTVGPFIAPTFDDGKLWGRGSCDAKGIAASMICAAERLVADGEERVDLLFVVGEEKGSDGAFAANDLPATSRALINGEPTEGKLASGSKGSLRVRVRTDGIAAHSAYPEEGRSAIQAMVALLAELNDVALPSDPVLGQTTINVGLIEGGEAANIIPARCEAELMIRLVGDRAPVERALETWADGRATLDYGASVPATHFVTVPGFETETVSYTTDAPLLGNWGRPLLFGPGSIRHAHGVDEHVVVDDLRAAVDTYEQLVRSLLLDLPR